MRAPAREYLGTSNAPVATSVGMGCTELQYAARSPWHESLRCRVVSISAASQPSTRSGVL